MLCSETAAPRRSGAGGQGEGVAGEGGGSGGGDGVHTGCMT